MTGMRASDKLHPWKSDYAVDRVDACRVMLAAHGFLSEAENERVKKRIDKWAVKDPNVKKVERVPLVASKKAGPDLMDALKKSLSGGIKP